MCRPVFSSFICFDVEIFYALPPNSIGKACFRAVSLPHSSVRLFVWTDLGGYSLLGVRQVSLVVRLLCDIEGYSRYEAYVSWYNKH